MAPRLAPRPPARIGYTEDLKASLPISCLEFWHARQDDIDDRARCAFEGVRPVEVDPPLMWSSYEDIGQTATATTTTSSMPG